MTGIEPVTPSLPWRCSTTEPHRHIILDELAHYMIYQENSRGIEWKYITMLLYLACLTPTKEGAYLGFIEEVSIYSACSESEHQSFYMDLFRGKGLTFFSLHSIVSLEWEGIRPSMTVDIARCRESESSIGWMIPVGTIMNGFISWSWPIREFIVIPSDVGKVVRDTYIFIP